MLIKNLAKCVIKWKKNKKSLILRCRIHNFFAMLCTSNLGPLVLLFWIWGKNQSTLLFQILVCLISRSDQKDLS